MGSAPDGQDGRRGYVAAANLATGNPVWQFETDVDDTGAILDNGCGGVWSSATVDAARGLAILSVADCNFQGTGPYNERVIALRVGNGTPAWVFTPPRLEKGDAACDFDFGATANSGRSPQNTAPFFGSQ